MHGVEKHKQDILSMEIAVAQLLNRKRQLQNAPATVGVKMQLREVTEKIKETRRMIAVSKRLLSFEKKAIRAVQGSSRRR